MTADSLVPQHPRSPGLRVKVAYLRPADRARTLACLADLGLFVCEWEAVSGVNNSHGDADVDLIVAFSDKSDTDAGVVAGLAESGAPVLGIVPPLAIAAMPEIDRVSWRAEGSLQEFAADVARMARDARVARDGEGDGPGADISLRCCPPQLSGSGKTVPLSEAECEVLTRLLAARGVPVATGQMGMAISAAYLKTIVMRLRRKLESVGADPVMLSSVRGYGYVLRR